jgi:hypothetical protein
MRSVAIVIGILALGACGPGVCRVDGGAACFKQPTQVMSTYESGGASYVPVLGCGAIVPTGSTMTVTLHGHIKDFNSAGAVAGATLDVFESGDYHGTIATATTGGDGAYSMSLTSGTLDLLWATISGGGVETQLIHQLRPDLGQAAVEVDFTTAPTAELDAIISSEPRVEIVRDHQLAQLSVRVLDCNRRRITRAVVVLSATAGVRDFVEGAPVFYSANGEEFPLPVSHEQISETGTDGSAVALNVPVNGGLYVQAWGFPDAAALARGEDGLVLIAEHVVARRAGAGTRVNLWANRG